VQINIKKNSSTKFFLAETKVIVVREPFNTSSSDSDSIFTSPVSTKSPPHRFHGATDTRTKLSIHKLENFEYLDNGRSSAVILKRTPNELLNLDENISNDQLEDEATDKMRNRCNVQSDQQTSRSDNNSTEKIFNNVSRIKKVDLPDLPPSFKSESQLY
jgi:hypothetical protein